MPTILLKIIVNKSILAGGVILGFTGGVIGYYLGEGGFILVGSILGTFLGGFIGTFGAKIFFSSVVTGALFLGAAGYWTGGWEMIEICAGTGAAIGGFIGIVIENYFQQRKKNENRVVDTRFYRS